MQKRSFPVVGIGASAGGIEALGQFFRPMPTDTGMAFIVVMHLPLGHESTMPEIMRRMNAMPVEAVTDGAQIKPDHIYVGLADHVVTVSDSHFKLHPRSSAAQAKPIDVLLSSLAEERREESVGVILSGAGSDGALGLKAIKEHGGLTLAQGADGTGPKQSSMPDSAIATGLVDLVLPAEAMAERLVEFKEGIAAVDEGDGAAFDETTQAVAQARLEICRIVHDQVGHDFSGYKEKTFLRRVRRRMELAQLSTLASYVDLLRKDPEEVTALFRDLLIGVTSFFRDTEAFEVLGDLLPRLFEGLGAADTVRIWVPGCSTGEEVYSIAILVREHLNTLRNAPKVQIFATDIDDAALAVARAGRYPQALLAGVSEERLKRFFVKDDVSYSVAKEVRDLCIFSPHSIVRDPPFSRIDLISCRNVLIYLGAEFQSRVIPMFHFALRPGGYLFLGTSENIGPHAELFQRVDRKHRLFQRRDNVTPSVQIPMLQLGARGRALSVGFHGSRAAAPQSAASIRRIAESRMLDHYTPAHVVVNRDGDVVHYSPHTGKYLEAAPGTPSRQLLALARRGLRPELRMVLQEAMETRRIATRERVQVEIDERVQLINLSVEPLGNHETDPLFLVMFHDIGTPLTPEAFKETRGTGDADEQLERELRDTRERLQATVEEYETAVEELKSSNEEMVSVNEELQSTNEELETSKEELQSVNEELQTVNLELNGKIDELDRANSDLRNVFESTGIASVFLDADMIIRSFTPAATVIFNLISSDRGRPLTDIVSRVDLGDLRRDVRTVIEQGQVIDRNVRSHDGRSHYMMRVLPYRGRHNTIDGVIVTFFDVTKLIEAERQQRLLVEELNHRVRNMLTVINAIAAQTLSRSSSLKEFGAAFLGRTQSLAKSHSLLSREQWAPVLLLDLLRLELDPFEKESDGRVKLAGPAVAFQPQAALALGLIFHELTTNALKYGALSKMSGKLSVHWAIEPANANGRRRQVVISWKEAGGPPVKAPKKQGFGGDLIDREIKNALQGTIARDFAAKGLSVQIAVPLDGAPGGPGGKDKKK